LGLWGGEGYLDRRTGRRFLKRKNHSPKKRGGDLIGQVAEGNTLLGSDIDSGTSGITLKGRKGVRGAKNSPERYWNCSRGKGKKSFEEGRPARVWTL